jgi:hypothetical protein
MPEIGTSGSYLLDLGGELLAFGLIGCLHPPSNEPLELRDVRPSDPSVRPSPRDAKVNGGIDDIGPPKLRVQQVPTPFVGWFLARPCGLD